MRASLPLGESDIIDGLEEFLSTSSLEWTSASCPAACEWECLQCGLPYQWAKVTLSVVWSSLGLVGRIESIEDAVPRNPAALDGVHLVQPELATLADSIYGDLPAWSAWSVEQRCSWW